MGKNSEVNVIEAETFIYYLLLTLPGQTVVLALKALGKQYPRMRKGLWRELWKAPKKARLGPLRALPGGVRGTSEIYKCISTSRLHFCYMFS